MASFHPKQGGIAMSTLDTTVSMIQKCTEDELQVVQQVIRQFFLNRGPHTTTKNNSLRNYKLPEGSIKAARVRRPVKRWRN